MPWKLTYYLLSLADSQSNRINRNQPEESTSGRDSPQRPLLSSTDRMWMWCAVLPIISLLHAHVIFKMHGNNSFQVAVHTHTQPFNGPFSRTTRVGRYQKGKTNLDFTEARDSEWQWHQLGICKSAPHSRQITTPAPHHSVFYRPDALPAAQPTASKHWRQTSDSSISITIQVAVHYP